MLGVIGQDPANRVIVFTGTGEYFIKAADVDTSQNVPVPTEGWMYADAWARRLSRNLLNIEIPIVAAVNGPFMVHSELAIMLLSASTERWETVAINATGLVRGLPEPVCLHSRSAPFGGRSRRSGPSAVLCGGPALSTSHRGGRLMALLGRVSSRTVIFDSNADYGRRGLQGSAWGLQAGPGAACARVCEVMR
jgi:hypothetical protein